MKRNYNTILEKAVEDFLAHSGKSLEDAIRITFETILKAEQDEFLGYVNGCRKDKSTSNKRNGYRQALVQGLQSTFRINIPRDRLGNFQPFFLDLLNSQRGKYDNLAFRLYSKGLTTRKIEEIFQELFEQNYSKSSISRITSNFTEYRKLWQNRPLDEDWYIIYIDAVKVKLRRDKVSNESMYVALGLKEDLSRDVLGVYNIPEESSEGWHSVLKDLKERGVKKVLCFAADGLKGLSETVSRVYPSSDFQRCLIHKLRNVLSKVRQNDKKEVASDFKAVFKLEDGSYRLEDGKCELDKFVKKWAKKYSSFENIFPEQERDDYFTYLKYPTKLHRMMYTTNWIEALNRIIRRTVKIRCSFPTEESALNLICARLMEHSETKLMRYKVTSLFACKDELDTMAKERRKISPQGTLR
ncbi:IS256 family transposase [Sedimentisphaera salicampi]|uniref:Mutator family transposase n=1 Tax=Sedimentisphaera salicampi TaxID=1941349 RepID=A0A1W6LJU5_9BACT|nr:IS256 family transposase [Sedimentisphaera salicampi]ARN56022.1 Transposase [Sedimentisphaera salicampi]ARN56825.1 Transposase [Sedimentisphaera salicampi]